MLFRREEVDLIFVYVSTYALSSTVLPVAQATGVPVVLLSLQPWPNSITRHSIASAIVGK